MLYDNNTIKNYQSAPDYLNAYDYAGGASGYNRANKGIESGVSNVAGGVLENIPVVSSFYKLGNSAYKGLKSTNSGTGDFFASWFAPHHQILGTLDDSKKINKRRKNLDLTYSADGRVMAGGNKDVFNDYVKDKNRNTATGLLNFFDPSGSTGSVIRGKDKRAEEQATIDYNNRLQEFYNAQTGNMMQDYEQINPVKYDSSITQGLIGGAMGLFSQYGKKKQDNNVQEVGYSDNTLPQDNIGTNQDTTIQLDAQGNNYNWNAGTYGFKDGGVMVHGGKGKDDIALVDTTTGEDTGKRVTKGEMLVINKDNVSALQSALKNKDKDTIFEIINSQFQQEPTIMNNEQHFAEGGKMARYVPQNLSSEDRQKLLSDDTVDYFMTDEEGNVVGPLTSYTNEQFAKVGSNTPDETLFSKTVENGTNTDNETIAKSVYESKASSKPWLDKIKGITDTIGGNAYDGWRFGMGVENSMKPLPEWQLPYDYLNYGEKLKTESTRGLTPLELAGLNQQANQNLAYGKENVYNLANGNAGTALGNIQSLGNQRMDDALKIASLNKAQERVNMDKYGSWLNGSTTWDRQQFLDKLTQDERTKSAAAQLAQDAYHNMKDRQDYNSAYGRGSQYQEYQNAVLQAKLLDNEAKQNYINSLK